MSSSNLELGNGFIEIAALTALIGASSAESLVLGSRGAAGLPWATMSMFGSIFVVKACVAASAPAWLRETMGVRSARSDSAVGLSVDLGGKMKGLNGSKDAVGAIVIVDQADKTGDSKLKMMQEVFAFDDYTSAPLRNCMFSEKAQPLQAYVYRRNLDGWIQLQRFRGRMDCLAMFLTSFKLVETFLLWRYGSRRLHLVTTVNWIYFLLSAIAIQISGQSREKMDDGKMDRVDIIAGKLPTAFIVGEERKVLFDAYPNVRKGSIWRVAWAIGSVICTASLIAAYTVMSSEPRACIYIWLGLQTFWLLLRILFYHFAPETDDGKQAHAFMLPAVVHPSHFSGYNYRLLALASSVSRHQVLHHPRGMYSYVDDLQDPNRMRHLFRQAGFGFVDKITIPAQNSTSRNLLGSDAKIELVEVIGDTMLSSIAWMIGLPFTSMDLYDTCVVAIKLSPTSSDIPVMVPSVRVLSSRPSGGLPPILAASQIALDEEADLGPHFIPKGTTNTGSGLAWRFWIPCEGGMWLTLCTEWSERPEQPIHILGPRTAKIESSGVVDKDLRAGNLNIGLTCIEDLDQALAMGRKVTESIISLLMGKSIY